MLEWVLKAARAAGCDRILVVVGHDADAIRQRAAADDVVFVEQRETLGTGHAVAQVESEIDAEATVLVLSGDVPLVTAETLARLAAAAEGGWGAMAVAELDHPGSLGRVIPDTAGRLDRIVEAADATEDELRVRLVNSGLYALPAPAIFARIRALDNDNAKGEYYLTDAVTSAARDGDTVSLVVLDDPSEALGVNTRRDLAQVQQALVDRQLRRLMDSGVTVIDPSRTVVEATVQVGRDSVLHPGVTLLGDTAIGTGCILHQGVWVQDCRLADDVVVLPYSVLEGAEVGPRARVGPFARLRPASVLLEDTRVGNFVELKKTHLGAGSKAGHLAYLGDATLGRDVNVGAGTITCNYDGQSKHPTTIGDGAFIGSDTMLVAPVRVGARAVTGAGSTVTQDVPDDALAVGRARQKTIPDWTARRRRNDDDG